MKRRNKIDKRMEKPSLPKPSHHIDELENVLELALCHVSELIGVAQGIPCNMHEGMGYPEANLQIAGRLATLMYCAARELSDAQKAAKLMIKHL